MGIGGVWVNCGYERRPWALRRAPLGVVPLALLAVLLLAAPVSAAVSFPDPQTLSATGEDADSPQVAIDGSDRPTVVWSRSDGTNSRIQAVRIGPLGNPGPVKTLSGAGQDADFPQVVVDDSDRATVVWSRSDGTNERIQSLRIAADGTPGPVQTLSATGEDADSPQVAIDGSDRPTVVWSRSDGTNSRIQAVRIGPLGNPGPVKTLSGAGQDADFPQVVVDDSDRATVVWSRSDGSNKRIQALRIAENGTPGPIRTLSAAGQDARYPDVAVDGIGRATVAWSRSDGSVYRVQSVRLGAAEGNPGPLKALSGAESDGDAWVEGVAVDGQGRAYVIWTDFVVYTFAIRIAADGTPGMPERWGAADLKLFQLVVDHTDRLWVGWNTEHGTAELARLAADGPPVVVFEKWWGSWSGELGPARLAFDSSGRPTVVWSHYDYVNDKWIGSIQWVRGEITYPETAITSGPAGLTNEASPSFGFSGGSSSSFECRLDGGGWSACSSPRAYSNLADGSHSFAVRAIDSQLDPDPTPATRGFTVDSTAPQTTITSGPAGTTDETSPSFGFSANEGGSSFECRLDGGGWSACSSPTAYSKLADGPHSFEVRATDPASNTDPTPARRDFTIDTTAPQTTITSGPSGLTNDASPAFGFSADEPGSSFECRLGSQSWALCSSPQSYSDLPDGPHRFEVQASLAGNSDPTPATRAFTVDTFVNGYASADGAQKQKGKRVVVNAKVTAGESLDAKASGKVKLGKKSYKLKKQSKSVSSGKSKTLKLKPKKSKDSKKIAKALKKGKKAKAKLTVKLIDAAGNKKTEKLKVKLKP